MRRRYLCYLNSCLVQVKTRNIERSSLDEWGYWSLYLISDLELWFHVAGEFSLQMSFKIFVNSVDGYTFSTLLDLEIDLLFEL